MSLLLRLYPRCDRLVTLISVHDALLTERLLAGACLTAVVVPAPRELEASCGHGLLYPAAEDAAVRQLLAEGGVRCGQWYRRGEAGWRRLGQAEEGGEAQ